MVKETLGDLPVTIDAWEISPENAQSLITIERMQYEDIEEFRDIILSCINGLGYVSDEAKTRERLMRSVSYYTKLYKDPEHWTLLAAKDGKGTVVGAVEAETMETDGKMAGYVKWICVSEGYRRQGIASSLYAEYEKLLLPIPDIYYLIARVDDQNTDSLAFHKKHSFDHTYWLDEIGRWYFKKIGQ